MEKKIIGIDLGGTTTKFAILTSDGEIQQKWSIDTNVLNEGSRIVPEIIESVNHRLGLYDMDSSDFIGIGLGVPGKVDREAGTIVGAYNLNWRTVQPVKEQIERETKIQVAIDNDANVAALGEQWKGAGDNDPNVVFVTLGTGVGGGIISEGKLLHGTAGCAGEIGHVIVDPDGFECTCGRKGCLETVSSATGVVRLARHLSEKFAGSSELKVQLDNGEEVTCKGISEAAQNEDKFAVMVVDRVCFYLGLACGNIANTLNPSSIVIGGGVSASGQFLRSRVETYFNTFAFPEVAQSTKIKLAVLGNDAGVIGAGSLVL
ncbi:ROK family glucokinase [Trichococcus flocculiformis]|uniref:ROK family glucokinase n=1 Tax=Trichococcus flocculiformis TaxID=82803 RepID=UPI002AAB0886|nr:ROK family glucokinase [Trichococcus flocculiformis]